MRIARQQWRCLMVCVSRTNVDVVTRSYSKLELIRNAGRKPFASSRFKRIQKQTQQIQEETHPLEFAGRVSLTREMISSPETEDERAVGDQALPPTAEPHKFPEPTIIIESIDQIPCHPVPKRQNSPQTEPSRIQTNPSHAQTEPSTAQANPSIAQTEPSCAQIESLERFNDDDLSLEDTAMIEIAHDVDSATSTPMHDEENYYGSYSSELAVGCVIGGRYEILSEIARGGYGIVYRARQIGVDRIVALKRLRSQSDPSVVQRFLLEMQIIKNLVHPNTIQLIDAGMDDDHMYIVMEHIEGDSLYQILMSEKKMSPLRAINIIRQVLKSVNEAHQRGIIHRDIKPSNILIRRVIGECDFVKVLDFGIAKSKNTSNMNITRSGHVMGTPHYLAPESILFGEHSCQSDIFAIGLIFCEMITGVRVLKGSITQVTKFLSNENPIYIPKEYDGTQLALIMRKALAKHPRDRYACADDMIRDLNELEYLIVRNNGLIAPVGVKERRTVSVFWLIACVSIAFICFMLMVGLLIAMNYGWL